MFNKKTYIMKTHFPFCKGFIMAAALTSIMGLSSCLDDDDENYYYINYPNALLSGENSLKQLLLANNQLVTRLIKFFD